MATKKENLARIKELEGILEKDVITTGLNAGEVSELVAEMEAEAAGIAASSDTETVSTGASVVIDATDEEVKEPIKADRYFVAELRALTTKRGIISEGKEIFPKDVHGGVETLERLCERKAVVKG